MWDVGKWSMVKNECLCGYQKKGSLCEGGDMGLYLRYVARDARPLYMDEHRVVSRQRGGKVARQREGEDGGQE